MWRYLGVSKFMLLIAVVGFISGCNGSSSSAVSAPGTIGVTSQDATISTGESAVITVTLSGATGINNVTVNLTSSESSVLSLSSSSCVITSSAVGQNTCSVTAMSGDESGVSTITATALGYQSATYTVTVNLKAIQYAYISDATQNKIFKCDLGTLGELNSCIAESDLDTNQVEPNKVTFNTINGSTYAYITTGGTAGGVLYICNVTNGDFTNCSNQSVTDGSGNEFSPNSIAFLNQGTNTYVYMTSFANNNPIYCNVNTSNGGFSGCSAVNTLTVGKLTYVAFASFESTTRAYFLNQEEFLRPSIYKCPSLTADGILGDCSGAKTLPFTNATSMDFRTESSALVYITEESSVKLCNVAEKGVESGNLLACSSTPLNNPPTWSPTSITVNQAPDKLYYAYVSDNTNSHLYKCSATVLSLFGLADCKIETITNIPALKPNGVSFLTVFN